jgi:hypothetical protein
VLEHAEALVSGGYHAVHRNHVGGSYKTKARAINAVIECILSRSAAKYHST